MNAWKSKRSEEYSAKLKDPRWQKMRLRILERDQWACQSCFDTQSMLVVHHRYYVRGKEPWDYPDYVLVTLCQACHEHEHEAYPDYADALIVALKSKGFLADDTSRLVDAIGGLEIRHAHEVTASAVAFALKDSATMEIIWQRFWAETHARAAAMRDTKPNASGEGNA